jgi:ABC-type multidrug transport system fused ATPase/permease subunit
VVGYFWLIKLYCFAIVAVITIYGAYLQYLTNYYCTNASPDLQKQSCAGLFGIWIVTNKDLKMLILEEKDESTLSRFETLRAVLFLLLLVINVLSLYVVKWFKVRHPDKLSVSNFSLLFKNLKNDRIDDLVGHLQREFGKF